MIDARARLVVFIFNGVSASGFEKRSAKEARPNVLNDRRSAALAAFRSGHLALLAVGALVGGMLTGCGDDAPTARKSAQPASSTMAPHQVKWLDLGHQISPAQWLVSRHEATLRPADDAEVQRVARQLAIAHKVYRESERMIANRAAQLSDMLVPLGIDESAPAVLDDLIGVANDIGMTEGFGAVVQHYFNLRASKVARDEALATLKSRYGGKRS